MTNGANGSKGPLDGIRVIDWTMWQFGPVSTMMLADLGAEVIKVESLDGDHGRQFGVIGGVKSQLNDEVKAYFSSLNRQKHGIAVDLKKPEGLEIMLNDIEHGILRPIWRDARIHYAVNCAAIGCPNLLRQAFRADTADDLLDSAARALGYVEEDVEETDLVTFSFGIAAGVALGLILFKVGNVSIGLGMAGGLLLMGILIGFASSLNPTFGRVPQPARYLLMELGLMLFMARVGLNAGGGILETLMSVGPVIILCGLTVTLVPACVAYFVGRRVMNLNPALLLGSVTGAMTSTPALNVLNQLAKSPVPALGYAGTYTIANVLLTFAGTLIAIL